MKQFLFSLLVLMAIACPCSLFAQQPLDFELECPEGSSPLIAGGKTFNASTQRWRANFCITPVTGHVICQADGCNTTTPPAGDEGAIQYLHTPALPLGAPPQFEGAAQFHYDFATDALTFPDGTRWNPSGVVGPLQINVFGFNSGLGIFSQAGYQGGAAPVQFNVPYRGPIDSGGSTALNMVIGNSSPHDVSTGTFGIDIAVVNDGGGNLDGAVGIILGPGAGTNSTALSFENWTHAIDVQAGGGDIHLGALTGTGTALCLDGSDIVIKCADPAPTESPGVSGSVTFGAGLIMQWAEGPQRGNSEGTDTTNLPVTCPTAVDHVQVTYEKQVPGAASDDAWYQVDSFTTSTVVTYKQSTGGTSANSKPFVFVICH